MFPIKTAVELVNTPIETGDTTTIPVNIPGMTLLQTLDVQQTQEQAKRFEMARELNIAQHDAGKNTPVPAHRLYKSTMDTTYIFKDGSFAIFRRKRFLTNNPAEISELDFEIKQKKNPYLLIDANELEADPALETPEAKLRAMLFAEWSEQMLRALNPTQDAGNTPVARLTPQSSSGINQIAAGGAPASGLSSQMQSVLDKIREAKSL